MTQPAAAGSRLTQIAPALLGATSFAFADVLVKVALNTGADVLTLDQRARRAGACPDLRLAPAGHAADPR